MHTPSRQEVRRFLDRVQDVAVARPADDVALPFESLAVRWRELGLRPGDPVLVALPNGLNLLEHFFGLLTAGGVPVLLAPHTPAARLTQLLGALGARALVAAHVPRDIPGLERHEALGRTHAGILAAKAAPAAAPGEVIILTSGTSGAGSGCVHGFDALLRNAAHHADSIGQRAKDTVLVSLPLHFSFALVAQTLATLLRGGRLVISGPPFHTSTYLKALADFNITVSSLTPVLVRSLLQGPTAFPSCLRVLTVGGDALPLAQVAQLLALRPRGELYLTYGLTQAGPRVLTLAVHREPPERHASAGQPIANTKVRLETLPDGSGRRQLLVSSDTLMRRRIGLVEGRAQDDWQSPDWLTTGDLFEQDEAGYLYFQGRISDFIVRRGEKINLATIRRAAMTMPHVQRARTQVVTRDDGEPDFSLTLATSGEARPTAEEYRVLLRRLLCRSELPYGIAVVPETAESAGYK